MMHESKSQRIGKAPSLHLFHTTVSTRKLLGSYLMHGYIQGTHTYTTDAMQILLDHTLLGHVGGGKWPGDEAKTMTCTIMALP